MAEFENPLLRPIVLRPIFNPQEGSPFEDFSDRQLFSLLHDSMGQQFARTIRAIPFEERRKKGGDLFEDRSDLVEGLSKGIEFVSRVYSLDDEALDWILGSSTPTSLN